MPDVSVGKPRAVRAGPIGRNIGVGCVGGAERIPLGAISSTPCSLRGARAAGLTRYFRCLPTSFVISNMFTADLPPKTGHSAASALIMRRFLASCSLCFLM